MEKDELITKQQLEIEDYKQRIKGNNELREKLRLKFIAIGQPMNDNKLQFNGEQLRWCSGVLDLIEQLAD